MTTFTAIIAILKSLVDLGMYLSKKIPHDEYVARLKKMDGYIYQASNGELGSRLEAGQEIEDVFNSRTR